MPRFLTLNKAIFHLLLWVLGERTGVLFVQIQQYRNMHQCWAWTFVCLFLCLPSLLLQIRDSLCNKNELLHSIPKILGWKKKKKRETALPASYFPFPLFPVCNVMLSDRSSLQTNTSGSGEGNRAAQPLIPPSFDSQMDWLDLGGCKEWDQALSFPAEEPGRDKQLLRALLGCVHRQPALTRAPHPSKTITALCFTQKYAAVPLV